MYVFMEEPLKKYETNKVQRLEFAKTYLTTKVLEKGYFFQ